MKTKDFDVKNYLDSPEMAQAYAREIVMEWGGLFECDLDNIFQALSRAGLAISVRKGASWSNG